jgi:glycine hydroxymethyltransferase
MDYREVRRLVIELTRENDEWRGKCVNLIPSENVMSPAAEKAYGASDFMHRYAEGDPFKRYYQGTKFIDQIETLCTDLSKKLWRAGEADVRPISGTVANIAMFTALVKPGDVVFSYGTTEGGHISHDRIGAAGVRGLEAVHYPTQSGWDIDLDATRKLALEKRPKVILAGGSLILFPHPVKELRAIADEVGARVAFDGAHVMGLIAGGQFQDPLREGAEVMTGSTHKTFPGPQGGVIMTTDSELFKTIKKSVFPGVVSNHHLHRLPAFAITAVEMLEFGEKYAGQVVANAQTLAQALHDEGLTIACADRGFTQSHQVVIDVRSIGDGATLAKQCEDANIILNKNALPGDPEKSWQKVGGLRTGVQEMTRFGMREAEMHEIAGFLARVLKGEAPAGVRRDVEEFRADFQQVHYCFDSEVSSSVLPLKL